MAPVRRPETENSISGLVLLDGDHTVVVTSEEDHQDTLAWYAPGPDGRPRQFAAELRFAPVRRGQHVGQRGIEVLLDGRRVGELTHRMAQRYGQLVDQVLAGGSRPGCMARVIDGRPAANGQRLLEVKLRLPDGPVAPPPGPGFGAGGYGAGGYGAGAGSRPVPPPGNQRPGDRGRRPNRRPLWIACGVGALLLMIGSTMGGDPASAPPPVSGPAADVIVDQPTTTPPTSTTPQPTPSAVVEPPAVDASVTVQAQAPAPRRTSTAAAPRTATSGAGTEASARSTPTTKRSTSAKADSGSSGGGCDPNYAGGCVPIASDVDCAGGSGNGPAYVVGPVRVVGTDKYRLDDDKNGLGCE